MGKLIIIIITFTIFIFTITHLLLHHSPSSSSSSSSSPSLTFTIFSFIIYISFPLRIFFFFFLCHDIICWSLYDMDGCCYCCCCIIVIIHNSTMIQQLHHRSIYISMMIVDMNYLYFLFHRTKIGDLQLSIHLLMHLNISTRQYIYRSIYLSIRHGREEDWLKAL